MVSHKLYPIAVVGANGGIGLQVVLAALKLGHTVTAIVRSPSKLQVSHPNLRIAHGDVLKPETLNKHLKNQQAVISAIGKNSFKKTTLYSLGNENLIEAMRRAGVNRAFFISASGLEVNPSHSIFIRLATKFILQPLLHNMYADLRKMEVIIKESKIDWTIVRPPRLTNHPATASYRIAINTFLNNGLKISRADVAHFIVANLTNDAVVKTTVEIAY